MNFALHVHVCNVTVLVLGACLQLDTLILSYFVESRKVVESKTSYDNMRGVSLHDWNHVGR